MSVTKDHQEPDRNRQDEKQADIYDDFKELVNMSASKLEKHLDSDASKTVGQKSESGGESVGHEYGKRIIHLLGKKKADLTDDDYDHMAHVVSYIKRHSAQRPKNVEPDAPWTVSLKNWGHDPELA